MKKQQPTFELGLYMLAGNEGASSTKAALAVEQRLDEILQAAKLSDEAGLDVFGIGGYSRNDYAISSPSVVLSHIKALIKLVSSHQMDPIRLFEEFVTLNMQSDGRLELIINREAFNESYHAKGHDSDQCAKLIEKHLNSLPISVKVEGSIDSAALAGKLGAKLALAVFGGNPEQFKPLVDAYRQEAVAARVPASQQQVTVTGHLYLAESDALAERQFYPYYRNYWRNAHAQGNTDMSPEQFHLMSTPDSALFVGSPELIIEKILQQHELYGHTRFLGRIDIGGVPFKYVAKTIEFFAERVAPVIRKELNH